MADEPSAFLHPSVQFVELMQGWDPERVSPVQHSAVGPRLTRQNLSVFGASRSCGAPCHACEFQTAGHKPLAKEAGGLCASHRWSVKYYFSTLEKMTKAHLVIRL